MRGFVPVPVLGVAAVAGLAAGAVGTTPALGLSPAAWQARLASDPTAAVALAAGCLLWLLVAVLGIGVLASLAALLPGLPGRLGAMIARRVTPALVRRTVGTLVGLSVAAAAAPGIASAAPAGPHGTGRPAASTQPAPGSLGLTSAYPPLGEPAGHVTETAPPSPAPVIAPAPVMATAPTGAGVTVQTGDTLWELADRSLGGHADPQAIARTWPTWWAANRAVIGADPNLLHPGQVLRPPSA